MCAEEPVAALSGLGVAAGVEGDAVDHRVETFVVGPQRVEDLPHHFEPNVVGERFRRLDPSRDSDGQDDVAVFLIGRQTHDPANRLHDVDNGVTGLQEQHRVQSGDVNPFG